MKQRQIPTPNEQESQEKPPQFTSTEKSHESILNELNSAIQQEITHKKYWTCYNRIAGGECKCTRKYGIVVVSDEAPKYYVKPTRCDKEGNPI